MHLKLKCFAIDCPPASWETVLEIAYSNTEGNYRIGIINVLPTYEGRFTDVGPEFITYSISYVSINPDIPPDNPILYSMKYINFEDKSQSLHRH